jgi:hypothetical protein
LAGRRRIFCELALGDAKRGKSAGGARIFYVLQGVSLATPAFAAPPGFSHPPRRVAGPRRHRLPEL